MLRYFFHLVYSDGRTVADDEGAMFENDESAILEADRVLREIVAHNTRFGRGNSDLRVELANDVGGIINSVRGEQIVA